MIGGPKKKPVKGSTSWIRSVAAKIKRAKSENKDNKFFDANMDDEQTTKLLHTVVLKMPKGNYTLHDIHGTGTDLIGAVYKDYGNMVSNLITDRLMLGMQVKYPKRVSASFTHDLEVIKLK